MQIFFVNQYYPPDQAPTGLMLEAVAAQAASSGHEVTVLCSAGGYAGQGAGKADAGEAVSAGHGGGKIRVLRVGATSFGRGSHLGKMADYLSFYLAVAWKILRSRPRPDRVVALTTPPYLSLMIRILTRLRGADHAHWVMDLYPDVMVAHGMLQEGKWLHRLLARMTAFGFGGKRCVSLLTLGPDMAERVSGYAPIGKGVDWVPLWATDADEGTAEEQEQAGRALRRERGWSDDELILMYSGNMGLGHRFAEFLKAASENAPKLRMVFYGRGKRRGEVERFIEENPEAAVELHDYVPREQLAAHLRSADVHLASLEPSWDGTMVPSKLQGIFRAARPVLFVGSDRSSIGRWIQESGGGWVVAQSDGDGVSSVIKESLTANELKRRGIEAQQFAFQRFRRSENASKVAEILTRDRSELSA